jgi:hypothetical protein
VFRRAAAAIAFLIGCGGPRSSDEDGEVVLRVSATGGLSELTPGIEVSGASAAAMDLVFAVPDQYIESMSAGGSTVTLLRRENASESTEDLARSLRGKELVSARALDSRRIEARFQDEKTATLVAQYQAVGFDLGPFAVDSTNSGTIRLVRRHGSGVDAIELVESTRADEWRRLMAHEIDVVPETASVYRSQFTGMSSIRALETPPGDTAALYFNVRARGLHSAAVRRRIAASLHRRAIADLACGDPDCASPSVAAEGSEQLPERLELLVIDELSTLGTAAKVVRHQLWPLGVELVIEPVSASDIVQRMTTGQFDLAMLPLSLADHRFGFFLSPGHPKGLPITGFANAEYDAAVDQGDLATAQAILDREVPVTRLFENRYFAAVDGRFCGDVTPTVGSWLWLSKLYPCEEGPPP